MLVCSRVYIFGEPDGYSLIIRKSISRPLSLPCHKKLISPSMGWHPAWYRMASRMVWDRRSAGRSTFQAQQSWLQLFSFTLCSNQPHVQANRTSTEVAYNWLVLILVVQISWRIKLSAEESCKVSPGWILSVESVRTSSGWTSSGGARGTSYSLAATTLSH